MGKKQEPRRGRRRAPLTADVPAEGRNPAARPPELRAWERRSDESGTAYAGFVAFRSLGPARSVVAAARSLGKHPSQFYRWTKTYEWPTRAWQWDLLQARQDEAAVRQERDEAARRQLKDADRMQQLCMAKLSELVHRDPATGELALDPSLSPRDAVSIYALSLQIHRSLAPAADAETPAQAAGSDLPSLPDAELQEVIRLARERAGQQTRPHRPNKEEQQHDTPSNE
jgi:hypothetical protein